MAHPRGIRRVGIVGHITGRNLGDEASFAALIQNIRRLYPRAEIVGFTLNPPDTEQRHGIPSFPLKTGFAKRQSAHVWQSFLSSPDQCEEYGRLTHIVKRNVKKMPMVRAWLQGMRKAVQGLRWLPRELGSLIRTYKIVKTIDVVIIAGSHQLNDYVGGPWGFPYTLYKWAWMAKNAGAKVVFLSVGAGPFQSWLGRRFARASLCLSDYRSFRDESSLQCVQQLGIREHNHVFPDLVYSLPIDRPMAGLKRRITRPVIGLNAVPFVDPRYWLGASERAYEEYVTKLGEFAIWLIETGHSVLFFPTQLHLDPPVINDIRTTMNKLGTGDFLKHILEVPIHSFDDLVGAISMMEIVVATRFHGIILPFLLNKPVLSIAYHQKTVDLASKMGQSEYLVHIQRFDLEQLQQRFLSLEANVTAVKREIEQRLALSRQALDDQYERLLTLFEAKDAESSLRTGEESSLSGLSLDR